MIGTALFCFGDNAIAQAQPPAVPPQVSPPDQPALSTTASAQPPPPAGSGTDTPVTPGTPDKPPSAASEATTPLQPKKNQVSVKVGSGKIGPNGEIDAKDVTIKYRDATVTGDQAVGNVDNDVIMSGHAHLVGHDLEAFADAIHAFPRSNSYRLDNMRGVVDPALLRGQILDKLYLDGGELLGNRTGYINAENTTATTCIEPHHHYELKAVQAELFPGDKIILRKVSFYLFDVKVLTLPYLMIPLDRRFRRVRTDYLPEFGQNSIEGYYARFPYEFAEKAFAATFLRLDVTQKQGEGYRVEQEYLAGKQESYFNTAGAGSQGGFTGSTTGTIANSFGYGELGHGLTRLGTGLGPQSGGLLTVQGLFADGFSKNFNASFKHQQGIGSNNKFSLSTQLQTSSLYTLGGGQTSQNTQFTFNHSDPTHGVTADFNIGLNSINSGLTSSKQLSAGLRESIDFASHGSNRNTISYSFNLNTSSSTTSSGATGTGGTTPSADTITRTGSLDGQFQMMHISRDYSLGLTANKSINLDPSAATSGFGTLERLPELQFSTQTINYKGGYFAKLPAQLDIAVGRYSEPGHLNQSRLEDDRITFAFKLPDFTLIRGRTELTTGAGFQQNYYSDTASQYMVTNTTRLRQHIAGRSGFDLTYSYQQPEGATPFYFDLFNRVHNVTAEGGYLDDNHFQLTMQTGYNFLKDYRQAPWQSVAAKLMVRPNPHLRFDSVATYDVNTSQWFNITNSVRIRANKNLSIDAVGMYDPPTHRWTELNTQYEIPLGRTWKFVGLLRYNGILKQFESRNFQIAHEWDCMEASLTYSDNPTSFINDKQLYFTLRIKALPFFRSFARGPAGQTLTAGTNGLF